MIWTLLLCARLGESRLDGLPSDVRRGLSSLIPAIRAGTPWAVRFYDGTSNIKEFLGMFCSWADAGWIADGTHPGKDGDTFRIL